MKKNESNHGLLGRNIRRERLLKGFSQEELAFRAGVGLSHLGRIERGTINVSSKIIFRIAFALEMSPGDFFPPLDKIKYE